ncbi:MAG: branched-chain amino acid ABC transporter permease, partial [Chloroflexota bacterium]|nr:branched-chain amino acid ABC transporter permease [Chloroflexota bacterium]
VGKAMRACAENREAASLVGINVRIMDLASFGLSAGLGAIAGIAIAPIAFFTYGSGPELGLKGLIAAVLGGMGNNMGALVGGMALALLETFSVAFISSEYKDAIAFLALMLVLLIKPSGIMGAAR